MPATQIPQETQTLYAELLDQLRALDAHRSLESLSGCFTTKTIKGETYYYFQSSEPGGRLQQTYIGKKTPTLEALVERFRIGKGESREELRSIRRLCTQIRMGGGLVTDPASARVLKALADGGVFHLGGVLIGTHAFIVLGNLLGVHWEGAALKTEDIDLAGRARLEVALSDIKSDIPNILDRLNMGFSPIPPLNPKHPSTSFKVRKRALRLDLLTPGRGDKPILINHFNAAAQPLPFLDYLMEKPEKGVVINGGGILVNVPSPAWFALHKLLTSGERSAAFHTKATKDIRQATQLLEILCEERPGDLDLAWSSLKGRGPGWVKRVRVSLQRLKTNNPEIYQQLLKTLEPLQP